jgi:protein-S-isoprenylcysteine O-methyltransferase Ste14
MNNSDSTPKSSKPTLGRSGVARIIQVFAILFLTGSILFISAGQWDWQQAWVYLVVYLILLLVNGIFMLRHDPELINERGRSAENTKSWDKILNIPFSIFYLLQFIVAGLDKRLRWSTLSQITEILGMIGFILGILLIFWVMRVNTFLSTKVRIQEERGHQVINAGPYQIVRHPMYVGYILYTISLPLLLGSILALIPGFLSIVVLIIRTALEDKTLQAELPGYVSYTQHVRYRLIPGIW